MDAGQSRDRRIVVEGLAPLAERMEKCGHFDMPEGSRRLGEIPDSALEHRPHADAVSGGVMMERDSDLDQPLKKLLIFGWGGAPNIFEGFVSIEEVGLVEQGDAAQILIRLHLFILA
jgi:hypothetical protein